MSVLFCSLFEKNSTILDNANTYAGKTMSQTIFSEDDTGTAWKLGMCLVQGSGTWKSGKLTKVS